MNSKKILVGAMVLGAAFFSSCGNQETKTASDSHEAHEQSDEIGSKDAKPVEYTVNASASKVAWEGTMLGLYSHNGLIGLKEGSIEMNGTELIAGSFVIDMTSIQTLDDRYGTDEGSRSEDLIGHLSSDQFFDIGNHPSASFTIKSVEGNSAVGTLKIRGTENDEKVENINVSEENGVMIINGEITFDRKKYGAMFDMPVADKVLSDDIKMTVSLKTQA